MQYHTCACLCDTFTSQTSTGKVLSLRLYYTCDRHDSDPRIPVHKRLNIATFNPINHDSDERLVTNPQYPITIRGQVETSRQAHTHHVSFCPLIRRTSHPPTTNFLNDLPLSQVQLRKLCALSLCVLVHVE